MVGEGLDRHQVDRRAAGGGEAAHSGDAVRVAIVGARALAVGDGGELIDAARLVGADLDRHDLEGAADFVAGDGSAGEQGELDLVPLATQLVAKLGHAAL